jgi:hypothetical protein
MSHRLQLKGKGEERFLDCARNDNALGAGCKAKERSADGVNVAAEAATYKAAAGAAGRSGQVTARTGPTMKSQDEAPARATRAASAKVH